jgi:hypothetical protein
MLAEVESGLAGAQNIENGGVETREILRESRSIVFVFLSCARHAVLDDGGLVENDVIGHGCDPRVRVREQAGARRVEFVFSLEIIASNMPASDFQKTERDDLMLQDARNSPQIDEIDVATGDIGAKARRIEQRDRIGLSIDEYRQIEIARRANRPFDARAEGLSGNERRMPLQFCDDGSVIRPEQTVIARPQRF